MGVLTSVGVSHGWVVDQPLLELELALNLNEDFWVFMMNSILYRVYQEICLKLPAMEYTSYPDMLLVLNLTKPRKPDRKVF